MLFHDLFYIVGQILMAVATTRTTSVATAAGMNALFAIPRLFHDRSGDHADEKQYATNDNNDLQSTHFTPSFWIS